MALDRQSKIMNLLNTTNSVKVPELSKLFNVTEETIRRDLEKLEKDGCLKRTHGGAIRIDLDPFAEISFNIRNVRNTKEKTLIGEFAAGLIESRDVIILDASTTALQVAIAMKKKKLEDVIVVTNAINVALELADQPGINLICTGGMLRGGALAFVGPLAEKAIQNYHVKKAFISCKGVSINAGITEADELQANLKTKMIDASEEVYILADYEKFGKAAFAPVIPINKVRRLITDNNTLPEELDKFKEQGIEVLVVAEERREEKLE